MSWDRTGPTGEIRFIVRDGQKVLQHKVGVLVDDWVKGYGDELYRDKVLKKVWQDVPTVNEDGTPVVLPQ